MTTDHVPVIDYLDSPPKRYEISVGGDRVIRWNETRDGAWVRFEDMDLYMFEGSQLIQKIVAEITHVREQLRTAIPAIETLNRTREELQTELGRARELLEQWMLASDDFDMNDWVLRVRNMLEDSNPFNSTPDDVPDATNNAGPESRPGSKS